MDDIESILKLAKIYENGEGVDKDINQAIDYYKRAAHLDDIESILKLAKICENGEGVDKDIKKAIDYYKKAAELGNVTAIRKLEEYENRKEIEENTPKPSESQIVSFFKSLASKLPFFKNN